MLCTLLTDFGEVDGYVAAMKGVIASRAPGIPILDLSHQIPPQDVHSGSYFWGMALDTFPAGSVHVGVIDPGVGTERAVCVATNGSQILVCPDNGLMSHWWRKQDAPQAFRVETSEFWLSDPSNTFHGRDIFAPTAAALAAGRVRPEDLGAEWSPIVLPEDGSEIGKKWARGCVTRIDHFGNVITSVVGRNLPFFESYEVAQLGFLPRVSTYGQSEPGTLVILEGSMGYLELAVVGGSAAERVPFSVGDSITFSWD